MKPGDRLLIAPDSFKGTMSSIDVSTLIADVASARGLIPVPMPLADGGEHSLDVLHRAMGGTMVVRKVLGTLQESTYFGYLLVNGGRVAYVELAGISGLDRIRRKGMMNNPMLATTYGTGQMLKRVVEDNPDLERLYLLVGGSASVDGGIGVLQGLGINVLDDRGRSLPLGSRAVSRVAAVGGIPGWLSSRSYLKAEVLCDVATPLVGPAGATRVYGPQKGLEGELLERVDRGMDRWGDVLDSYAGKGISRMEHGGAAGGVPAAMHGILGWKHSDGFEHISEVVGFREALSATDTVLTGEGRTDAQSLDRKVVGKVCGLCRRARRELVLLSGEVEGELPEGVGRAASIVEMIRQRKKVKLSEARRLALGMPRRYLGMAARSFLSTKAVE